MIEEPLNFNKYIDRRKFTDDAHKRWMPTIYDLFHWTELPVTDEHAAFINDVKHGQDYYVKDAAGHELSIQERNRTGEQALRYNDITLRYSYPEYAKSIRASEWFKIDADILIYTVVGKQPTYLSDLNQYDSYDKVAVINMRLFEAYVHANRIQITEGLTAKTSVMTTTTMPDTGEPVPILLSPLRHNRGHVGDSPSNFIVFDVKHLYQLNPNMIGYDKGFGTPKDVLLQN